MKEKTVILYNINELQQVNKNAYDKIIEKTRDDIINMRFDYDALYEIKNILQEKHNLNVDDKNIYYSISYCQGDGMCFILNNILSYTRIKNKSNLNAFETWIINNLNDDELCLLLEYLNDNYNLCIKKISHNYCHPYTCIIDYEYFYNSDEKTEDNMNNFLDDLCKRLFKNVYLSICYEIEKYLYTFYDVDDYECLDYLTENECYYDANGTQYE